MGTLVTQGNAIVVSADTGGRRQSSADSGQALSSWVASRVEKWEDHRNAGYQKRWAEYWRLWRGQWATEDRNRESERSRLIAPALAQSIESTVAELEESIFGKEVWFDIADDIDDQEKNDAIAARDRLLEDFECVNAKDAITESVLNAAIFGTGILKLSVEVVSDYRLERGPGRQLDRKDNERAYVYVHSIRPDEFIPDPAGKTIQQMLGCAHRVKVPKHTVLEKIESGVYRREASAVLFPSPQSDQNATDYTDPQVYAATDSDTIDLLEYHGKVPASLLASFTSRGESSPLDEILSSEPLSDVDEPLVEAIVTIANSSVVLRAMRNPFVMTDRSIIAFQFEKVPGRFWGRGVAEKGYNPQKALDSELRARQDALGFISSPMVGVDIGRLPKGFKLEVKPGKVWAFTGAPSDSVTPITLGDLNAATFNQTQEMERMVQMGTGAFDTATPLRSQSQSGANAASSNSGLLGAFVKRAKRALRQIEVHALQPLIAKTLWRYMQFEPARYPADYEFTVKGTLGIVAREVEAMQLTQLMGMLPEAAPGVSLAVAQGIIDNSSVSNKQQIVKAIEAASQPPSPEEQQKQAQLQEMQFEALKAQAEGEIIKNQKTLAEIRKILAEASAAAQRGRLDVVETQQEQQRIGLQAAELQTFREQNELAMKRIELQEKMAEAKLQEMRSKRATPQAQ